MAETKGLRINEQIRVREVRLIDEEGNQKGIIPTKEALVMAHEANLDLVEIAPQSNPPVCKILDYGKYRFEMEKKLRDSKKKQKLLKLKEIRMQPKIDDHDLDFKSKHIREFLADGNKVKVTIRFRGRELAHTELGLEVWNSGPGMDPDRLAAVQAELADGKVGDKETSIGLLNVNERIRMAFGAQYGVELFSGPGQGVLARVTMPCLMWEEDSHEYSGG